MFSFPDRKDRKPLLKELPVFNPQGGNRDFKERRRSKDFLGFEIFDSGIFGVGKFDFGGYSKQTGDSWKCPYSSRVTLFAKHLNILYHLMLYGSMGFVFFFFWEGRGLIFGPGIFGEVVGSPRDYFGF